MIPTVPYDAVSAVQLEDGVWHQVANRSFGVGVAERRGRAVVWHVPWCREETCTAWVVWASPDGVVNTVPVQRIRELRTAEREVAA